MSVWKKLWEKDFESFVEIQLEIIVDEVVSICKGLGLEVKSDCMKDFLQLKGILFKY